jgi:anti-sigma regulatory factor (Ser/Thr protein kinase)
VLSATAVSRLAVDPTRMAQLLGNLLSNAVKFTPEGGKVEVGLRTEGDQAVLTVSDTGIGIPVVDRQRIFERFFRTATAKRQAIQGTGLGLTITQAIVAAHNGTITVEGDEGQGSTFVVRLPLWPMPTPDTAARASARNVPLRPRRRAWRGPHSGQDPGLSIDSTRVPRSTSVAYCWPSMPNWSMAAATRWMRVPSTGPIG